MADTGLCKFRQKISTDIRRLGKRTGLKFGELSPLVILYNITTSQLFPLDGFRFFFLLRDSAYQQFIATCSGGRKKVQDDMFWHTL